MKGVPEGDSIGKMGSTSSVLYEIIVALFVQYDY